MWIIYTLNKRGIWQDDMSVNNFHVALDMQQFTEYTLGVACAIRQGY